MIKNISETPYVYSYTVPDHKGHKENIIELIKKIPHNPYETCLLYTSPSPRDATLARMPSSA